MNDAVKPAVSDETLAQEFARLVAEYHGASEDDPTRPEAWNLLADLAVENGPSISAALAAQGQEPVAEMRELHNQRRMIVSHATMGRTDGEGQSINDICVTITKLRNELYEEASKSTLTAPAQPVGVPDGWQLVPIEPTDEMIAAGRMARMNAVGGYAGPSGWQATLAAAPQPPAEDGWTFRKGDRVRKTKGASWQGRIVGFYSTNLTPIGYAVESEREPGSVQIYPEGALEPAPANGGEQNG